MRKEMLMAFVPGAAATIALVLSFFSNFWCENVKFEPVGGETEENPTLSFGVFYEKGLKETNRGNITLVGEACLRYDDIQKDGNWTATMVFACIAFVIGGIGVIWTWLAPCIYLSQKKWKLIGISYIFCCLFQGLTFLFLNSNVCTDNQLVNSVGSPYPEECSWDVGTRMNIAAVVFWFVAGVLMVKAIPNSGPPPTPPAETQTITYQEKKNANGTTTVEETNVVKGTYVPGKDIEE
mmetsp:Transcript_1576/g.2316  ORF Transcript_1576/g.2316 Transcript_1576/m.2316 type:complete len:237 (+) Transcript_1576:191-901(+)|eukprot:CAMPEP_0194240390 /NCGR_PEP_ID=MMETSP0158-20130606/6575_1 /TAXON_ID=33649 /ORGANISM="Thalassionema nitzschioides, Strain L26-B" /LENGTH=236 /DNA_ID=CAMNT_0038975077 /DNA_START=115 /DNA_END=825 /DNA_ORIENTATION=+